LTALFARNANQGVFWWTAAVCFPLVIVYEVGSMVWEFDTSSSLGIFWSWIRANRSSVEITLGAVLPLLISLTVVAFSPRRISSGWQDQVLLPLPPAMSSSKNAVFTCSYLPCQES
jgi:hypothetical protein